MSSIREVAKRAEVSIATVSRVINNDPVVNPKTREKVLKVIEELKYEPNLLAKNFRRRESRMVVMVLPSMSNPYFSGIAKGAEAAVTERGYHVIIGTMESKKHVLETYIHLLKTNLAEGMIFVSSSISDEMLGPLVNKYPIVLCTENNNASFDLTCVTIDNRKAGYEATKEFIKRGHKHIVYITGDKDSSSVRGRTAGYKDALREAGIPFDPKYIVKSKNKFEDVKNAVNELVLKGLPIEAVLTHSDLQASFVLKGINEKSVFLHKGIGLISFDGTFVTEITNPKISSIDQPLYELGYAAVHALIDELEHKTNEKKMIVLPHQFTIRET